jgi:uncharacterized PurR-regulated membrane protein YhhQ (DUF165 family)
MRLRTVITLAAYIATIPAANILVTQFGAVPVGFGLAAPAGVFTVGLALVLRDLAHEWAGTRIVWAAIAVGSLLSFLLADPAIAAASAVAFAVAESLDLLVYAPLRRRGLLLALLASNAVGIAVDSLLFLQLAFGDLTYLWGQIAAKSWMTLLAAAVLAGIVRRRKQANPAEAAGLESCGCLLVQRFLCGHCKHDRCEDCGQCAGAGHGVHECLALIGGPA